MTHQTKLFTPLQIKSIEFKNRIWISPMCQYSSINGHPTDWHFVHLGSRAVGGAGLIMVEATAVSPQGRISPDDSGIWSDEHIVDFKRLSDVIKKQGTVSGIQIAHAGRKGSVSAPWEGDDVLPESNRGWQTIAPSPIPFKEGNPKPQEMSHEDINKTVEAFKLAAKRCLEAGFQVLELHMAHGYLLHQFLSPLSNHRTDEYGGNLENRMRFPLAVAKMVRETWPKDLPLFARISATDWAHGPDELKQDIESAVEHKSAWTATDSITFCRKLKEIGIDLIDCSSGGTLAKASMPIGPGYQVPFSDIIRRETQLMTTAVGMITEPMQAESILLQQQADAIFIGRESLRNPYWPQHAARALDTAIQKPNQYARS